MCISLSTLSRPVLYVTFGILYISNPVNAQSVSRQIVVTQELHNDSVVRYRELIQDLEIKHGPYHDSLSEPLISLGRALNASGAYPDARETLLRAQQNIRINKGIYHPGQIPVVNMLIESSAAAGNWEDVDDRYHQLLWLHERLYADDNNILLEQIRNQVNWHITALNFSHGKQSAEHLLSVSSLYDRGIRILEEQYAHTDPVLAQWLYKKILTDFYIVAAIKKGREPGAELLESLASHDIRFGYMAASEALIDDIYDDGNDVFTQIADIFSMQPGNATSRLAVLSVYQADWHLLFNKPDKAMELYGLAGEKLKQAGVTDTAVTEYFNRPVILPVQELILDFSIHTDVIRRGQLFLQDRDTILAIEDVTANTPFFLGWSPELPGIPMPVSGLLDFAPPNTEQQAVAVFNVDESGWPENIDILSYYPETFVTRNRAYNTVWAIQFRPVLQEGKAVRVMDATLSYIIPQ